MLPPHIDIVMYSTPRTVLIPNLPFGGSIRNPAACALLRRIVDHLSVENGKLRIKLKRVDLINCDAAFGNIQLFM